MTKVFALKGSRNISKAIRSAMVAETAIRPFHPVVSVTTSHDRKRTDWNVQQLAMKDDGIRVANMLLSKALASTDSVLGNIDLSGKVNVRGKAVGTEWKFRPGVYVLIACRIANMIGADDYADVTQAQIDSLYDSLAAIVAERDAAGHGPGKLVSANESADIAANANAFAIAILNELIPYDAIVSIQGNMIRTISFHGKSVNLEAIRSASIASLD